MGAVLGSSQEALPLPCLIVCLPGVETGDIVQSVDNGFLWKDCDNQTVHYHGVRNWFLLNVSFGCVVILAIIGKGAIHHNHKSCMF